VSSAFLALIEFGLDDFLQPIEFFQHQDELRLFAKAAPQGSLAAPIVVSVMLAAWLVPAVASRRVYVRSSPKGFERASEGSRLGSRVLTHDATSRFRRIHEPSCSAEVNRGASSRPTCC
jgi:hypothetical protein